MSTNNDFFKVQNWYPALSPYTFNTLFVKLREDAVAALASLAGAEKNYPVNNEVSKQVIGDLARPMADIPGSAFVFTDICAPTDTERFTEKGGSVFSPRSAWYYLTRSEKVCRAAADGNVEYVALRPFRHISSAREFRLFIVDGQLMAMVQYNLNRHYRRLEGVKERYYKKVEKFVSEVAWRLPVQKLVMDIYITSDEEILIFDLNPWGGDTDPLLLRTWERDWSETAGIVLMAPPTAIKGDVKVSF